MSTCSQILNIHGKILIQGRVVYPLQERTLSDFRFSKAIAVPRNSGVTRSKISMKPRSDLVVSFGICLTGCSPFKKILCHGDFHIIEWCVCIIFFAGNICCKNSSWYCPSCFTIFVWCTPACIAIYSRKYLMKLQWIICVQNTLCNSFFRWKQRLWFLRLNEHIIVLQQQDYGKISSASAPSTYT